MRLALVIATVLAGLVGVTVLGLVIGAGLRPTGNLYAVIGSMVWAPFGPVLLLAALLAFAIGVAARLGGLRRLGGAVAALSALGTAGAGVIVARISLADWPPVRRSTCRRCCGPGPWTSLPRI